MLIFVLKIRIHIMLIVLYQLQLKNVILKFIKVIQVGN